MMTAPQPTKLELSGDAALVIRWNNGTARQYSFRELRDACPCASCREKRKQPPPAASLLPVLSADEARPLKVLGMNPVGNYAYSITFSDGHDTGIFTLEHLYSLGREAVL